jgi:signal transduction histidine kinase
MDITKEKKRAEELMEAKKKAEAANLAKSEFINNVSHELRTPLHAILSFSSFGTDKLQNAVNLPPEFPKDKLAEYFENIKISATRQLHLVNDLLDLSKLESGKMQFHFQKGDLISLLELVKTALEPLLETKKLRIIHDIADDAQFMIMDSNRMEQVFYNLISNAIRFSPANGTITIRSRLTDSSPEESKQPERLNSVDQKCAEISVEDQGAGIKDGEFNVLFDKFYQSQQTHTGGTGLGLSICRQIISEHGGKIKAINSEKGGAVFIFTIPMELKEGTKK